ncbi:MAG: hypothetical protein CVU73_05595 [Deltaproteobacteria bacterium HGW-Deltaproteobacteria-8]|jgi:two-component sensor histidine kinase|nr:MAG: hypothetical protein CVU73_05595 [Deltaproteobacteria bacterium HGW-Deltaproteobacteria-8]
MNGVALHVKKPLPRRLLKRVLLFSAVLIVLLAGARAWWEYQTTLATVNEEFAVIESTKAKSVAASLWDLDREQLALHVEGIRHFRYITYASVRDAEGVVAQSGMRRDKGVQDREFPLSVVYNGQRQELGVLHVQADLETLRQAAWRTAWLVLAFNAAMVFLVAGLMFWLTNDMISRHLAVFAAHLGSFSLESDYEPLVLDKKPAGDELDVLASALNTMQSGLASSYNQVIEAQAESRSLARFPQENPSPVLRAGAGGLLLAANPASADLLAHLGAQVGQRLPEGYAATVSRALASGEVQRFEGDFGGRAFTFAASPVSAEGFVNIYGMDITQRKLAEEEVRRSLHEKEILLKEIHHRVKNNLQIISSLLFLQAEYVIDPQDRSMFEESQKRISAMALVHEELYDSRDLSSVDMGDYVSRLVERVVASSDTSVRMEFDVEDMRLPVTQSIPCGLVLNEMIMNAVKHAFKSGREGRLRVSLLRRGGQAELAVEDNGPGLPTDFNLESSATLGLTLITSLARQLGGSVLAEDLAQGLETGARFTLLFPAEGL